MASVYELSFQLYNKMPWVNVDSSNIKRFYYVEKSQQLYIEFLKKTTDVSANNELIYVYFNVTPQEYNKLKNAESKGKEFHQSIRDKKQTFKVVITDKPKSATDTAKPPAKGHTKYTIKKR
jgi:hypothetical protein